MRYKLPELLVSATYNLFTVIGEIFEQSNESLSRFSKLLVKITQTLLNVLPLE